MSVTIRRARTDDADAISAISLDVSFEQPPTVPRQPHEARKAGDEREKIEHADALGLCWLVAVDDADGRVVGFLAARRELREAMKHVANLGITVAAPARGRGVGRALMLACEAWAREVGVRKLTLGVFHDNERARRLYRSLGYEEEGVRRGQFVLEGRSIDEVLMSKWL